MPSFNFFLGAVSEIQRSNFFSSFPILLPHHVTYDVMTIIKTFCMSSRTNGENFVSIRQAVAEKNMKVLCGQTNEPKRNTLSFGEGNKQWIFQYFIRTIFKQGN